MFNPFTRRLIARQRAAKRTTVRTFVPIGPFVNERTLRRIVKRDELRGRGF